MFSGDVPRVARDILRWRVGRFRGFGGERRDRVVYVSELGWCWLKRRFGSSTAKRVVSRLREAGLVYRRRKVVNARTGRRVWVVRATPVLRLFCSKVGD